MRKPEDKTLETMLRITLSAEREVPLEVERDLRRAVRTGERKDGRKLFVAAILLNAVMTFLSETAVILLLPYFPVRVFAVFHIFLSLSAVIALLFFRRQLFVFLEGVYSK